MAGGVSQREAARILKLNKKTVVRKFRLAGLKALEELPKQNARYGLATEVQFDDLETFEHTKLKPLSVTLMVESKSRRVLGFKVSSMPAKGLLARESRKKYGFRHDGRSRAREKLFREVKPFIHPQARIRSDSNPHYPYSVKKHFPQAKHETVLGGRGAIVGQGELKKLKFDPLFSLNHTCAMLRDRIKRLSRKTWCTTKRADQLALNIALYAVEHNRRLATG